MQLKDLGKRCELPQARAPAEIKFNAFWLQNMTSGDNSFNYFPQN